MTADDRLHAEIRVKSNAAGHLGFLYLPALVVLEVSGLLERAADQLERFNQRHEPTPTPAEQKRTRKAPPA